MSDESYVQHEQDFEEFNSNLEQTDDETDYEDEPTIDLQQGAANNLTENSNVSDYIRNNNELPNQHGIPTSSQWSNYHDAEYYNITRKQCLGKEIPSVTGVLSERLRNISQYLRINSQDNIQPSKSITGVIGRNLKKKKIERPLPELFSRKNIEKQLPELSIRENIERPLAGFVRVIDNYGNIYYEYVGDISVCEEEETSEPLYEILPISKPIHSEDIYDSIYPELPPRIPPGPFRKKSDNNLKQELYYQNIIEPNREVRSQNLFLPKLPPRTPLSIPYSPEFETIDGQLTRHLLYKILLPTFSLRPATLHTIKSKNELNLTFQYELLLSLLKPPTKHIYQNIREDLNYFYYNIAIAFRLPQNMQICKPTISKLISISEPYINYKILLFLEKLPDSTLYPILSRILPETPNCSSADTETKVDYSNYSWNEKRFPISLSYSKESKIKTYLQSQLSKTVSSNIEKKEVEVIILSFNIPPSTSPSNDIETNSTGYYASPRNYSSYNNIETKSSEYYALPQNNTSCNDLETKYSDNYKTPQQIDNLYINNKLCLHYEIILPPHISAPHPFVHRNPSIPPLSPDYPALESFLSRSRKTSNRLSIFGLQYELIYEDISNYYHEIRYDNSLFCPHNEDSYLYGRTEEGLYDQIPDGYRSDISNITYDPVRWSMARIDKQGKPWKLIFGLVWTIICTGMYIVDVGSDISLALRYWSKGERLYCGLTLSLVYLASIVDVLYCIYRKEFTAKDLNFWFRFIIMFLINLRGVSEYVYLMKLEYRIIKISFENKDIKRNLQLQRARVAALNSYEGIFEACPQLVLQLYLILLVMDKDLNVTFIMQVVTVISSLCACGATFVNMEKGLRLEDYGVNDLSILGFVVQYLWLSPLTASRLLSVALLLLVAPQWLWMGAALHLFLGAILYWCRDEARASPRKVVNACVYGARVLVSPYEPEYVRHVVPALNVVHILQNSAATAAWAAFTAPCASAALVTAVCAINIAAHILGLLFAILFHKCKRNFYTFHKIPVDDYGHAFHIV